MLFLKFYNFLFLLFLSRISATETLIANSCPNDNLIYPANAYVHTLVKLTTTKVLIAIACQSSGIYFEIRNDANQIITQKMIAEISPSNGLFKVESFKDGSFVISAFNTQTSLLIFQIFDVSGVKTFTNARVFPHSQVESVNGVWTMIISRRTVNELIVFAGHMTSVDTKSFSYIIYKKDGSAQLSISNTDSSKLNSINIAELMNSRFVITYVKLRADFPSTDFFYLIIQFDGTVILKESRGTPSSIYSEWNRFNGVPIYYEENEFAIVYSKTENNQDSQNDIFIITYQLDGTYILTTQLNSVRNVKNLKLVRNLYPGSNKWIVSWEVTNGQDGDGYGIYYVILTGGSITVSEKRANTITAGDQFLQDVIPLTLNTFAVAFTSHREDKTNYNTVIMTYNVNGVVIKSEISLNTAMTNSASTYPKMVLFESTKEVFTIWKGGISSSSCRIYYNLASIYCGSNDQNCIIETPKITISKILLRNNLNTPLTDKMILAEEGDKTIYSFSVTQVANGQLKLSASPSTQITTFTLSDITSNKIIFVRTNDSPNLKLTVADSLMTSIAFDISFLIITPTMAWVTFTVFKGNAIILTEAQLNGTIYGNHLAIFSISNAFNCFFVNIDSLGNQITSFSSAALRANKIKFTHDNSETIPMFDISISDGIETSSVMSSTLTLKYLFLSFIQSLTIKSGKALDFSPQYIQFEGPDNFDFISTNLASLTIQKKSSPNIPINTFTNTELLQNQIQIVHDGSETQPIFCLKISDSHNQSPSACATFKIILEPTLLVNKVRVVQGQILLIDENMIKGRVDQTLALLYRVKSTANCFFAHSKNKYAPVTSFNRDNLISNQIFLVPDGSETAPNYDIEVFDGEFTGTLAPKISFFKLPLMTTNALSLVEGETIILNSVGVDVQGSSFYNYKLTYYVTNVLNGYFKLSSNPSSAIQKFSEDELSQKMVSFVHSSDSEPFFEISVKDDVGLSRTLPVSLQYTTKIQITKNYFSFNRGESIIVSTENINATSLVDGSSIIIYIEENAFCWFENTNYPSVEIKSFTKKTLKGNLIKLFHDGSVNRPSFQIKVSDGTQKSKLIEAAIEYNGIRSLIVERNDVFISQGGKMILRSYMLKVTNGLPNANFMFHINDHKYCSFNKGNDLNSIVSEFKQSDIDSKQILIMHDDSEHSPSFELLIYEVGATEGLQLTINGKIGFNRKPKLIKNQIILNKGEKISINSNFIQASDFESNRTIFIFIVINQKNCRFERRSEPGLMIEIFYDYEIEQSLILIVHDKTDNPPYYMISVSDGSRQSEFLEPDIKFFIPKGLASLLKTNELSTTLMSDIQFYKDEEYLVGILYHGILLIINIYQSFQPILITSIYLKLNFGFSKLINLKIVNDIAFVTSQEKSLGIIDLSNIENPTFKGYLDEANVLVCGMDTFKNYTYLALCNNGLKIVFLGSNWKLVELFNYKRGSESFKAVSVVQNTIGLITESGNVILLDISDKMKVPVFLSIIALIGTGTDIKLSGDLQLAYASTSTWLYILDISHVLQPLVKSKTNFKGGLNIKLSSDSTYLLVNVKKGFSFFNIQNSEVPILLDSAFYSFNVNNMIMNNLGDCVYLPSSRGLQTIKVLKADKTRISPYLSVSTMNRLLLSKCTSILTTKSNDVSYISCQNEGLLIYSIITNVVTTTITGTFTSILFRNIEQEIYAIKDGQIVIYNVVNKLSPVIIQTISIENSDLYFLQFSPSQNYFAAISQAAKYFIIYDMESLKPLSKKVSLKSICNPNYASFNHLEEIFYINCEFKEILVYSVKDKSNPIYLTSYWYGEVKAMIYYLDNDLNEYLFITDTNDETLKVIDVTSSLSSKKIYSRFIGDSVGSLKILNNNYLIVQSSKLISILEIRDASRMFLVNEITSDAIAYCDQIAVTESFIYLPYFISFKLYEGKTFFAPYLFVKNSQSAKIFTINLHSIDPESLDRSSEFIKLLDAKVEGDWPFWALFDIGGLSLTITPPNRESLNKLRGLTIVFSSQINFEEMTDIGTKTNLEIFDHLLLNGYIDAEREVTAKFHPYKALRLDFGYDADAISEVLTKHYFIHNLNFVLNDFISLNNPPSLTANLQSQINKLGKLKLYKVFDFQFDSTTFIDRDLDSLTYTCSELPDWLSFSPSTQRFYGTPTKTDLGKYSISVSAFDGFSTTSDNFELLVTNSPPISLNIDNQILKLGDSYDWQIPQKTFIDPDGDVLIYKVKIRQNGVLKDIPEWLNFDNEKERLYGKPGVTDIEKDVGKNQYLQIFEIVISAIDLADQTSSVSFFLRVENNAPIFSSKFQAQSPQNIIIGFSYDWTLPGDSFSDPNGDILKYYCFVKNGEKEEKLPNWLNFDADRKRLFGFPNTIDIAFDFVNNMYYQDFNIIVNVSDVVGLKAQFSFKLTVLNHAPQVSYSIVNNDLNQKSIMGRIYDYSLKKNSFLDTDNDDLFYSVWLIVDGKEKELPFWLEFDTERKRLFGTPKKSDIQYDPELKRHYQVFTLRVKATDPAKLSNHFDLQLTIINYVPIYNEINENLMKQNFILGQSYDWSLPEKTFFDLDNDELSYSAKFYDESKEKILPSWLFFNSEKRQFFGTPSTNDVFFEQEKSRYYQEFILIVETIDSVQLSNSFNFTIIVENNMPFSNPDEAFSLQNQFYNLVGNRVKVSQKIDFQILPSSFLDKDMEPLQYSVLNLPKWLRFDASTRRFFGSPAKKDLGAYEIIVHCLDFAFNISQIFFIEVNNTKPSTFQVPDVQLILSKSLGHSLPITTFFDADGDKLRYEATGKKDESLPDWLVFNQERLLFTGTPNIEDIKYDKKERAYLQDFFLKVTAFDVADEYASVEFKLSVFNYAPRINPNRTLYRQFKDSDPQVNKMAVLTMDSETFIDLNGDELTYEARLAYSTENGNNDTLLPGWIVFDDKKRSFALSPTPTELFKTYYINITAKNDLFESWDILEFKVVLSWEYILTVLGSISATMGTILGLLKYKTTIFAVFLKKKYKYPNPATAFVDDVFGYDILLIADDYQTARIIFKAMKKLKRTKKMNWDDFFMDYDNLEDLINSTVEKIKKKSKDFEVEELLLQKEYRIYEIINAFIVYAKVECDSNSKMVLDDIRNRLEQKYFKQWYHDLVSIEMHKDVALISKSFPTAKLQKENILDQITESSKRLKTQVKKKCLCKKKKVFNSDLVNIDLIMNALSPLAIGIPMLSNKSRTEGGCLLMDPKEFLKIEINRFESDPSFIQSILKNMPISIDSAVQDTNWLNYRFKNGMMIFFGSPDRSDIGTYEIRIYDKKSFIVREFCIEVVEKLDENLQIITPLMYQNMKIMKSRLSQGGTSTFLSIEEKVNRYSLNKQEIERKKNSKGNSTLNSAGKLSNSSKIIICKGDDEAVNLESEASLKRNKYK